MPLARTKHAPAGHRLFLPIAAAVFGGLAVLPWIASFGPVTGEKSGILAAVVVTLIPGIMLLFASRQLVRPSRLRQALSLLGLSMVLSSAGNLLRFVGDCGVPFPTIPGLSLGTTFGIWALGLAALIRVPLMPLVPGSGWRIANDIAVAGLGMALAVFVIWALPGLGMVAPAVRFHIMMYNCMEAGNLIVLNLILVRGPQRQIRSAVWWLSATVVIETVYLIAFQYGIGRQSYDDRLTNSLFFIDYLAYLFAAANFLSDWQPDSNSQLPPLRMWVVNPLPVFAVLGVGALLILSALHKSWSSVIALSVGIVVMSALLLGRVIGSSMANVRLIQERAEGEQRLQALKLELITRLSRSISHIINNLMTVVMTHTGLLGADAGWNPPFRESLNTINEAALKASGLARRLRLVGGDRNKSEVQMKLADCLAAQQISVSQIVGQKRDVIWAFTGSHGNALVAPSDLDVIVRELVANAVEATIHGGKIMVGVRDEELDLPSARIGPGLPPGRYSVIEVSDTGRGVAESDIPHVVEPFFTTKPFYEGRGLGLSIVNGIVASYGGGLRVDSVPGSGLRVRVYFPIAEDGKARATPSASRPECAEI